MTTKITYVANDGTEFNSRDACEQYAQEVLFKQADFLGKVILFDYKGNSTIVDGTLTLCEFLTAFDEASYLQFKAEDAIDSFWDFLKNQDYTNSLDEYAETNKFRVGDIYKVHLTDIYNELIWSNYSDEVKEYVALEKKMKEWGK